VLGGLAFFGYTYVDSATPSIGQHSQNSTEHYEDAWVEGHATFLSCALMDDEHYHDGYDTNYNSHLATPNILVGPHCEGSIQQALWRIYKHHGTDFKDGFWKAFTDTSKRKCETIFDFYRNWKDLGIANLDKVVESFKKLNMEYGYDYVERYSCIAQKTTLFGAIKLNSYSAAKKEFAMVAELHANLGRSGKSAEYHEEFFNRNKQENAGAMPATSQYNAAKVTVGNSYIAPKTFKVST
jgi:hypothetical protein